MVRSDWKKQLAQYLCQPELAWNNPDERQVVKLHSVFSRASKEHGLDKDGLIETVIHAVEQRAPDDQEPIYLSNLGGCGSHWVSRMMAQASGLVDVGEVYVPVPWYSTMLDLPRDAAARMLDGIELIHGLLYNGDPGGFVGARIINSAHGYERIGFHRTVRTHARIVHLARDPRDRTMSVSFRKSEFRNYEDACAGDREYFMAKAVRSLSAWRKYDALESKADIEIRYESFRKGAAEQLENLLSALELPVARVLAETVAHRNSPEFLRGDQVPKAERGNLDQGGIAKSWRELPADMQRELHSTVAPVLTAQGYSLCDCFPEVEDMGLTSCEGLAEAAAQLDVSDAHVDFKHRSDAAWVPFSKVDLSRVARIRLRPGARPLPQSLVAQLRPWITDVCAAGVRGFDNQSLEEIGCLPAMRYLDLARTAVKLPLRLTTLPALRRINLSGTQVNDLDQAGVAVDSDY